MSSVFLPSKTYQIKSETDNPEFRGIFVAIPLILTQVDTNPEMMTLKSFYKSFK